MMIFTIKSLDKGECCWKSRRSFTNWSCNHSPKLVPSVPSVVEFLWFFHFCSCKVLIPIVFHPQVASQLVLNTFKRSTAERMPSECSQPRYTCGILEYLFKSTAERVPSECSQPRYTCDIFLLLILGFSSYFSPRGRILLFHMCLNCIRNACTDTIVIPAFK